MPVTVTFMDGYQLQCEIDPAYIVRDLFYEAGSSVGLRSFFGFALYETLGEQGI